MKKIFIVCLFLGACAPSRYPVLIFNKDQVTHEELRDKYSNVYIHNTENLTDVLGSIAPVHLKDKDFKNYFNTFQVFIDEKGQLESIFLVNPSIQIFDSLCIRSLKNSKYKQVKYFDRPIKYSLIFNYSVSDDSVVYPVINNIYSRPSSTSNTELKIIKKVAPRYPDKLRREGIEGRVVLQITVNKAGKVTEITVLKSSHPLLNNVAIEAALKCEFEPIKDTDVDNVIMSIPFDFKLN